MNKRVLAGVLALLLFMAGFVRAGAANYHEGDVEEYVMQQLSAANIPGVSLSIVTSQKEIYSVAFGDVKETSSNLQICQLTRTFTTLGVMQLVEKGDINLDDKVSKYIKDTSLNIPYSTTIQDLLSYTKPSGNELALADTLEIYNLDAEGQEMPLNTKFNLLGRVIEAVSGMDYAAYIKENITTPLDMQSTYTVDEAGSSTDITQGCRNYFGLPLKDSIDYKEESYWLGVPSNGLVSNVKDIGKYMQMYLSAGGKIISYNTMESIINNNGEYAGKSIFGTDAYYTMGWISTETEGEQVYYCNGSVENYTSAMFIIPSMDIGVVILFNSADALTGQKYTDEIEAGAVSLIMGKTAKAVSSNSYLMEHGMADIIYFLAFVCAIMPLLMMEVWVRWTKDKFSIIRLAADILIHIVLPSYLIYAADTYIAPWKVIMKVMPGLFFVATVVIGLFYLGLVIKIIAYIIIMLKARRADDEEYTDEEDTEEENTEQDNSLYTDTSGSSWRDNKKEDKQKDKRTEDRKNKKEDKNTAERETKEKEAKEKKDKLLKRMKDIKEAEKNETEKNETESRIQEPQAYTAEAGEEQNNMEQPEGEILAGEPEVQENTEPVPEDNVPENNARESVSVKDTRAERTGNKTNKPKPRPENARPKPRPQNNLKNKQGQDRQYSKPKRFVVVNDSSAQRQAKGNNIPDNRKNNNKGGSKSSPDNRNRNNKNTNNKNINNKKKSNYNNQGRKNNSQ